MSQRSQRPAPERHARSRLAQLITEQPFLRGSLVERARSCGKPTCRCQQGHLHRSLYRATRLHGRRALRYLPRALEETVRANREAFHRWRIVPRFLRDVSARNLSVQILGHRFPAPLLLAPVGVHAMLHPEAVMISLHPH